MTKKRAREKKFDAALAVSDVVRSEQKVAFDMNDMMLEATRLTRANRLVEATALIQRMLRGETDSEIARLGNRPPTIDGYAETIDETKPSHFKAAAVRSRRIISETLRDPTYRFKYPSRHGLQGWIAARTVIHAGHCAGGREVH